jgi:hypothetical protein
MPFSWAKHRVSLRAIISQKVISFISYATEKEMLWSLERCRTPPYSSPWRISLRGTIKKIPRHVHIYWVVGYPWESGNLSVEGRMRGCLDFA